MKKHLLYIILFFCYLFSKNVEANNSFQPKVDSLQTVLKKTNDLKKQAEIYNQLSELEYNYGELKTAFNYALEANKIAKKIKNDYEIGVSYSGMAQYYSYTNNYTESIKYYEKALAYFKKINDLWRVAFTAFYLGNQYSYLSIKDQALKSYYTSLEYYQKNNQPEGIIMACIKIGLIYSSTDEFEKAPEYFEKAIKLCEETNDEHNKIHIIQSFGLHYYKNNQLDLALKYFYEQEKLAKKKKEYDHDLASAYVYIGEIKTKQGKLNEALSYLKNSEKVYDEMGSIKGKMGSIRRLAVVYYEQKKYDLAKQLIQTSIDYHLKTKEKNPLFDDYRVLSLINEGTGEYKSALEHYKLFKIYQDSLKLDDASKTAMKYEFDKKEAELKAEQQAELTRKNVIANTTYGVLGSILLFSILGLYTYWIRNKKLKLEKQNLDLKRREAELAKDSEAFKTQFLSNISHEFRTPLTLINGHLEILQKENDPKNSKRFNEMEYSGKRLLQLINQLLDLTKIETKKYSLYYKKGNLLNEIQNYVQAFHSLAEQRKIDLNIHISDAAKEKLELRNFIYSSEAIASIMNNLVSNAIKFTSEGGYVKITIDFIIDKLYISVEDNGSGIPEKDLPHIFDRFYQVRNDEKPIYEGSGIGLAIVKELSQLHGGGAKVENNEEKGSKFIVWIKEGNEITETENALFSNIKINTKTENISEVNNITFTDKPLILVIEDQNELRKFIVENLKIDCHFLEAENGKLGLELAIDRVPDLIISDVMMPELSGFDLTKQLKQNEITSHIPILLLTAKTDKNDIIEGLEYGADDYLTKPFSISELELRIKNRLIQQENLRKKYSDNQITANEIEDISLSSLDKKFIEKLNTIVIENIQNEIDVSFLSSKIGLSNSQLTRKLKVIIGLTPANFIKNIQLNYALELLKEGYSVSEACWKSGFTDPAYFSKIFKKHFGYLPSNKENF